MATIVVTDPQGDPGQQYDWVSNSDGTWRGPLEGEDMLTLQQVFDQIRRLQIGGLEVELPVDCFPVACCDRIFVTADAADQHEAEHEEES